MEKRTKQQLENIGKAIEPYGWVIVSYKRTKKHAKVVISDGKIRRTLVCSVSPSCHRAIKNQAATARRLVLENM